jgi:5'-3' exonuclease
LDGLHLVIGLLKGVSLGASALAGFPSLQTLPHRAELITHGVNVFQSDSRNKSLVLFIGNSADRDPNIVAEETVGKRVYTGWPFLREGEVVAISDASFRYARSQSTQDTILAVQHRPEEQRLWQGKAERIEESFSKRFGVVIGPVTHLIHVQPIRG